MSYPTTTKSHFQSYDISLDKIFVKMKSNRWHQRWWGYFLKYEFATYNYIFNGLIIREIRKFLF